VTWARVFTAVSQLPATTASVPGACIVQRLSPGTLDHGGNRVQVTIRGASIPEVLPGGGPVNLTLSKVTISTPDQSGDDFDSAENQLKELPLSSPFMVEAGTARALPEVDFNVKAAEPLLIAFDVLDPADARALGGVPHTAYLKRAGPGGPVSNAGTADRSDFETHNCQLWLIDAIDVATIWPPIS
jgi:hypothetical protein